MDELNRALYELAFGDDLYDIRESVIWVTDEKTIYDDICKEVY